MSSSSLVNNNRYRLLNTITLLRGEGMSINTLSNLMGIDKKIIYDDIDVLIRESKFPIVMKNNRLVELEKIENKPQNKLKKLILNDNTYEKLIEDIRRILRIENAADSFEENKCEDRKKKINSWEKQLKNIKKLNEMDRINEFYTVLDNIWDYETDYIDRMRDEDGFISRLRAGGFDEYRFSISDYGPNVEVIMTSAEYDILNDFLNVHNLEKALYIKNSNITDLDENKVDDIIFLLEVIENGDSIDFIYEGATYKRKRTIRPIKILHNTNDDIYYLFDHHGNSYLVDKLSEMHISDKKQNISSKINLDRFNKMWGVNYSERGTRIKLKIYDEGNVIDRVKNDLGSKVSDKTFSYFEDKGYAIYEDEVIGVDNFLSWVYSYGSSMVVLEPRELVDRVINSIKERKESL